MMLYDNDFDKLSSITGEQGEPPFLMAAKDERGLALKKTELSHYKRRKQNV